MHQTLAGNAQSGTDWEAAFYGSVLAANTGLRGGEIKKLRIKAVDVELRRLVIRRAETNTDAGARTTNSIGMQLKLHIVSCCAPICSEQKTLSTT